MLLRQLLEGKAANGAPDALPVMSRLRQPTRWPPTPGPQLSAIRYDFARPAARYPHPASLTKCRSPRLSLRRRAREYLKGQ
jgi:hypothetical protein